MLLRKHVWLDRVQLDSQSHTAVSYVWLKLLCMVECARKKACGMLVPTWLAGSILGWLPKAAGVVLWLTRRLSCSR